MTKWELEVSKTLSILVAIYHPAMTNDQTDAYLLVLKRMNLTADEVARAADIVLNDPKQTRFPTPAQLRAALGADDDHTARDVASRIVECIHKNSGNPDRAREKLGEIGWMVVERYGGWSEMTKRYPEASDIAQWRELALTFIQQARTGTLNTVPALPRSSVRGELAPLDMTKLLPTKTVQS